MQLYEYLIVDNGFMMTNRTGSQSMSTEKNLSDKLTNEYGRQGWKLVSILGEDLIFIRPLQEQLEAQAKALEEATKKQVKKKVIGSNE